jgi:hypothetical protein
MWCINRPKTDTILMLTFLLSYVLLNAGFVADSLGHPVLGKLIGNGSGLLAGALVSVAGVSKVIDWRRKEEWYTIREMTYKTIIYHISYIGLFASLAFLDLTEEEQEKLQGYDCNIRAGVKNPNKDAVGALIELSDFLSTLSEKYNATSGEGDWRNKAIQFWYYHDLITWRLGDIRNILIPRVLVSSSNTDVCEALVSFDNALVAYQDKILFMKDNWEKRLKDYPGDLKYSRPAHPNEFTNLIYIGATAYEYILEDLNL